MTLTELSNIDKKKALDRLILKVYELEGALDRTIKTSSNDLRPLALISPTIAKGAQAILKEHYNSLNKLGKSIEKNDHADPFFFESNQRNQFQGKEPLIGRTIAMHLAQNGMLDIVETLKTESGIQISDKTINDYKKFQNILDAFDNKDLELAMNWAIENQHSLNVHHSTLEFDLYKLQFFLFLELNEPWKALAFARTYLARFGESQLKSIQQAMGALLFSTAPSHLNPYADLIESEFCWKETRTLFIQEYSILMNISVNSPLNVICDAAILALPTLIKRNSILKPTQQRRKSLSHLMTSPSSSGQDTSNIAQFRGSAAARFANYQDFATFSGNNSRGDNDELNSTTTTTTTSTTTTGLRQSLGSNYFRVRSRSLSTMNPSISQPQQSPQQQEAASLRSLISGGGDTTSLRQSLDAQQSLIKFDPNSINNSSSSLTDPNSDELILEISLPSRYRYHSIFTCPVSKQQATEQNPPVMLTCGHVIAKLSFDTLSKGLDKSFKCPYCPIESQPGTSLTLII